MVFAPLENLVYDSINILMFSPPVFFQLSSSTSLLCVLNGIKTRNGPLKPQLYK